VNLESEGSGPIGDYVAYHWEEPKLETKMQVNPGAGSGLGSSYL
jgi:hypothetical protein